MKNKDTLFLILAGALVFLYMRGRSLTAAGTSPQPGDPNFVGPVLGPGDESFIGPTADPSWAYVFVYQ